MLPYAFRESRSRKPELTGDQDGVGQSRASKAAKCLPAWGISSAWWSGVDDPSEAKGWVNRPHASVTIMAREPKKLESRLAAVYLDGTTGWGRVGQMG